MHAATIRAAFPSLEVLHIFMTISLQHLAVLQIACMINLWKLTVVDLLMHELQVCLFSCRHPMCSSPLKTHATLLELR